MTARQIVCEEWQRAVKEFGLRPGTQLETVMARIINRLDMEEALPMDKQEQKKAVKKSVEKLNEKQIKNVKRQLKDLKKAGILDEKKSLRG